MGGQVKIPGVGPIDKKYAYIGAAGMAGFVGYMYWRNRQSAASTDTTATDPTTVDPSTYDPSLDYSAYGDSSGYIGGTGVYQSPPSQVIPIPSEGQITTNAAWDAAAVAAASDIGVDAQALSSALGRYLAGLCVSEAQADYVRQAQGMFGMPPQTPSLSVKICPGGTGTGSSPGTDLAAPGGLHVTSTTTTHVSLAWNAVAGAAGYRVYRSDVSSNVGSSTGPAFSVGGLAHNKTYHFHVRAVGSDGKYSTHSSSTVSGKTKK